MYQLYQFINFPLVVCLIRFFQFKFYYLPPIMSSSSSFTHRILEVEIVHLKIYCTRIILFEVNFFDLKA